MKWLCFLLLSLLLTGCTEPPAPAAKLSATELLSTVDQAGFARATAPREFSFPRDHGGHPEYRNEWWYFTGNLQSVSGRRFGYQVTFFRFSLTPPGSVKSDSSWAGNPVWMAHVALTDADDQRHLAEERLVRSGPGLAGVEAAPLKVWVENWQLDGSESAFPWRIDIQGKTFSLALELEPTVGIILQGDQGLSRKSAQPGNASYYYSYPRMRTTGRITLDDTAVQVQGDSWFDREWGTSALAADQTGWDWFSLQLSGGENLMYYQLRNSDGEPDPFSAGTLVSAIGQSERLNPDDIELTPERWWQSPTGRRYPVEWSLRIKSQNRTLRIKPVLDDQEMDLSVRYWEGAVEVFEQKHLTGRGYLEMTGY